MGQNLRIPYCASKQAVVQVNSGLFENPTFLSRTIFINKPRTSLSKGQTAPVLRGKYVKDYVVIPRLLCFKGDGKWTCIIPKEDI